MEKVITEGGTGRKGRREKGERKEREEITGTEVGRMKERGRIGIIGKNNPISIRKGERRRERERGREKST